MNAAVSIHLKRLLALLVLCLAVTVSVTVPLAAQGDEVLWYETEMINPGLGATSRDVDRSSPRAALRSFVELAEAGDLKAAAHVLNLSEFTKNEQQALGSQLAAKLLSILDRKLEIDWSGFQPNRMRGRPTPQMITTVRSLGATISSKSST